MSSRLGTLSFFYYKIRNFEASAVMTILYCIQSDLPVKIIPNREFILRSRIRLSNKKSGYFLLTEVCIELHMETSKERYIDKILAKDLSVRSLTDYFFSKRKSRPPKETVFLRGFLQSTFQCGIPWKPMGVRSPSWEVISGYFHEVF